KYPFEALTTADASNRTVGAQRMRHIRPGPRAEPAEMKLSHSMARLCALTLLAASALALFGARSAFAADPSISVTVTPNPAAVNANVTFTATVTSAVAPPDGTVSFLASELGSPIAIVALGPAGAPAQTATYTTNNLPAGPYSVTAQYTPSFTASLALGLFGTLTSIVQSVTVGAPAQPSYQTQI